MQHKSLASLCRGLKLILNFDLVTQNKFDSSSGEEKLTGEVWKWLGKTIGAGPSKKGAYGFSEVIRANAVDDVIYDVTLENVNMLLTS